eukprot:TRINITY_DN3565_c0_g1_i2.p1 TRINITY_DN3565_c0_g1~~TRINITY_DN3565_c0_g1_i2.p1  ORF type:complete len:582 (+),score=87.61 TRINITY_DN3565_c0_g1_i2:231-1976(+)
MIESMKTTPQFDVLVIGGGAVGAGVALDAVSRDLSVALVERDDFASGTSSRSTKLLHGGVRYLERAIKKLDYGEWELVQEALTERRHLLTNACHLSRPMPILLPVYNWIDLPQYWVGLKLYDWIAGANSGVEPSHFLSRDQVLKEFPILKAEGLKCGIVYSDGLHNDAKMNVAIAITAAEYGAKVANHCEVINLIKENERVVGAHVRDHATGREFPVRAKVVINATGAFSDGVRRMDDPHATKSVSPAAGVHIVLPEQFCPNRDLGMLDAKTKDGRVIFILPFETATLVGTTDSSAEITALPSPTDAEIDFILDHVKGYFVDSVGKNVTRADIKSAWSGLRPLSLDPSKPNTALLSRTHVVHASKSGLLNVVGGKWTTYRQMAQDTVDRAVVLGELAHAGPCNTLNMPLHGAHLYKDFAPDQRKKHRDELISIYGFEPDVASHLVHNYGDNAHLVGMLAQRTAPGPSRSSVRKLPKEFDPYKRIAKDFPYIQAEILYSMDHEYACSVTDFLARRTRLAFLHEKEARKAVPLVAHIMGDRLAWSTAERDRHIADAYVLLDSMMPPPSSTKPLASMTSGAAEL